MNAPNHGVSGEIALLTPEQVRELVTSAVAVALAERETETGPSLLDRRGLAAALNIGVDGVDKLRKLGMPTVMVIEAPRFEFSAVLEWLRARNTKPDPA